MSRVINVFKCIVNISSQDFGVYFRGKAYFGVGSKAEQHGDAGEAVNDESEVIMEAGWSVGGHGGWFWTLLIFLEAGGWVVKLQSLLGRLWWNFAWAGGQKFGEFASLRTSSVTMKVAACYTACISISATGPWD